MNSFGNLFDIIILLGAIQGFISSLLLSKTTRKHPSNKWLAWLLFFLSLACFNIYLESLEFTHEGSFWPVVLSVVPMIIIMPIGPLIYFYIKNRNNPDFSPTSKEKALFYLIIFDIVPQLVAVFYIIQWLFNIGINLEGSVISDFIDSYNRYVDIPRWLGVSIYLWNSWLYVKRNDKPNINKNWSFQLVFGFMLFQCIWLIHLIPYILPFSYDWLLDNVWWYPIYVPLVVLVYWLGINGFIFSAKIGSRESSKMVLNQGIINRTIIELKKAMEVDKLYLNPILNLSLLVDHIDAPQKTISAVLNQHMGKSFNEYINTYRVNEIQKRLQSPDYRHLTIAAIAYDCGFNSQATFQRTFKLITGKSPRNYLTSISAAE